MLENSFSEKKMKHLDLLDVKIDVLFFQKVNFKYNYQIKERLL